LRALRERDLRDPFLLALREALRDDLRERLVLRLGAASAFADFFPLRDLRLFPPSIPRRFASLSSAIIILYIQKFIFLENIKINEQILLYQYYDFSDFNSSAF
jgi:hypothetical protein